MIDLFVYKYVHMTRDENTCKRNEFRFDTLSPVVDCINSNVRERAGTTICETMYIGRSISPRQVLLVYACAVDRDHRSPRKKKINARGS